MSILPDHILDKLRVLRDQKAREEKRQEYEHGRSQEEEQQQEQHQG